MEVRFYHLTRDPLDIALPSLLEKVVKAGHTVVVHGSDEDQLRALDKALWTFRADSFLPHAVAGSAHDSEQTILLTQNHEAPNKADVLVLLDGAESPLMESCAMTLMMFDGANADVVSTCRAHWSKQKAAGAELTYWQQSDTGAWSQKA